MPKYVRVLKAVYDESGESALHVPAGSLVRFISTEDQYNIMVETMDYRFRFMVELDDTINIRIAFGSSPGEIPPPRISVVNGIDVLRYGYCSADIDHRMAEVPKSFMQPLERSLSDTFHVVDNQNTLYVFPYLELRDPNGISDEMLCVYFHDDKVFFGYGIVEGWF